MDNKNLQRIIAYLPPFSFTLAYFIIQYAISGAILTVAPIDVLRPLLILTLFLIGCVLIAKRYFKNDHISGLVLLAIFELIFFSPRFFIISVIISSIMIPLWVGFCYLFKKKVVWGHISFLLASLGFGLALGYGIMLRTVPWELYLRSITDKDNKPAAILTAPTKPSDIYFIILDGYVRSDVLKELYGFDNSEFTNFLLKNNFIIPTDNHSNYAKTALSVSSTLNMQYVQTLLPDAERWPFWWLMTPFIKNSQVRMMLENAGYKTVSVASEWEITNLDDADIFLKPYPIRMNDYEKLLFHTSPLSLFTPFVEKFTLLNTYPSHRKMVEFELKAISEIPDLESPKFVYAHIIAVHPPFIFDKNGNSITPEYKFSFGDDKEFPGNLEQYRTGYIHQLQFINHQMESVIDSILKSSVNPPIIIILGDHGSGMLTDYSTPSNGCIRERFSNFAAFYLPGMEKNEFPMDISSVNIFRLIFDRYFGTDLKLLENEYYFPGDPTFIFRYKDIADRLNDQCEISILDHSGS